MINIHIKNWTENATSVSFIIESFDRLSDNDENYFLFIVTFHFIVNVIEMRNMLYHLLFL